MRSVSFSSSRALPTGAAGRAMFSSARCLSTSAASTGSGDTASARGAASTGKEQSGLRIRVCIRVRPENAQEANTSRVVEVIDNQSLVFDPWHMTKGTRGHSSSTSTRRARNKSFGFDRVFGPTATQEEVYTESTAGIVDSVLDGYNATVFAYGATGSGKTHTMMGNARVGPGVMGLAMRELWSKIDQAKDEYEFKVSVSCLEVYNEMLYDLFEPGSGVLEMWDDTQGHAVVSKLRVLHPGSVEEVQQMLMAANTRRRQSPTDANKESSRSHAIFQVTVTKKPRVSGVTVNVLEGKLNLIDLAGSERASRTNNREETLREGANINLSLLALANCINALGDSYRTGAHVPYRNSKLTRLLKDSLGGTSKTVMIAAISPSSLSFEDTYNTLNYASRTRNIKINATRKVIPVRANVGQYRQKIEDLSTTVTELRERLKDAEARLAACSCVSAQPPRTQALAERLQRLFAERAAAFHRLRSVHGRIDALALRSSSAGSSSGSGSGSGGGGDAAQMLADAHDERERLARALSTNETALAVVRAEVEVLPPRERDAALHEARALAFEAYAAQCAFLAACQSATTLLITDISATGLIPLSHPLAARVRAFLLDNNSAAGHADPLASFAAAPAAAAAAAAAPFTTTTTTTAAATATSTGNAAAAGEEEGTGYTSPVRSPRRLTTPPPSGGRLSSSIAAHTVTIPHSLRPQPSSPPLRSADLPAGTLKRTAQQARLAAVEPSLKRVVTVSDGVVVALPAQPQPPAAAAPTATATGSGRSVLGTAPTYLYGGRREMFAPSLAADVLTSTSSSSSSSSSSTGSGADGGDAAAASTARSSIFASLAAGRPGSRDYAARYGRSASTLSTSTDAGAFMPPPATTDTSGRQLRSILKTGSRRADDSAAYHDAPKSVTFSETQSYSDGHTVTTRTTSYGARSPATGSSSSSSILGSTIGSATRRLGSFVMPPFRTTTANATTYPAAAAAAATAPAPALSTSSTTSTTTSMTTTTTTTTNPAAGSRQGAKTVLFK